MFGGEGVGIDVGDGGAAVGLHFQCFAEWNNDEDLLAHDQCWHEPVDDMSKNSKHCCENLNVPPCWYKEFVKVSSTGQARICKSNPKRRSWEAVCGVSDTESNRASSRVLHTQR